MGTSKKCDILIIGGGTGGCAAAMAATAMGHRVIMTEEFAWIGGQLTSQAVPPDEHPWIESFGCTLRYRRFRELVRQYYRDYYPLIASARENPRLNPGGGWVSRLCMEPRVGLAVLEGMLSAARAIGLLEVWTEWVPIRTDQEGDHVKGVEVRSLRTGETVFIEASYVLDATELGDLLPMTGTEFVVGQESRADTGEPSATEAEGEQDIQGFTWCFAMGFDPGGNHVIEKPKGYQEWAQYVPPVDPAWPGKLFSWTVSNPVTWQPRTFTMFGELGMFSYRQIVNHNILSGGDNVCDVTIVNWAQNDLLEGVIGKSPEEVARTYDRAKQLSLSLLYWLQTEAPRDEGGYGYPELFLAPEVVGTRDGLAMAPYHRESRRIRAEFVVTENHVGVTARDGFSSAAQFHDSIGIGAYRIDLHPSTNGRNSVDLASYPFQIPLGALIPIRMKNLIPACKNLGVTHITNGCYRLHPVEWNIGEAAGFLAAYCLQHRVSPSAVRNDAEHLGRFQHLLRAQGFELEWPSLRPL